MWHVGGAEAEQVGGAGQSNSSQVCQIWLFYGQDNLLEHPQLEFLKLQLRSDSS